MKLRTQWVAAIAASLAVTTLGGAASAQSRSTSIYNSSVRMASQNVAVPEDLPSRQVTSSGQMQPSPVPGPGNATGMPGGYYQGGYTDGQCSSGCCDNGYCSDCYSDPCCDSGSDCCGLGDLCGMGSGQFFVTAEYLYVQANFSEATAFIAQDLGAGTDYFVPLDFDYQSSYRIGGGWRTCNCGDEIRFMFTRFNSDASETAVFGDIVPFAPPPPDGRTDINADVDAKFWDIECAKTIPLGGQTCGCGDSCGGCGDACGKCCPAWDITWSGGIRWADVGWNRSYVAFDDTNFPVTDARTGMVFHGGGLRTGLEGRRYFFSDGWLSIYGKGNLSLLLGDVHMQSTRESDDGATFVSQTFVNRQIIPVTELEAGLTAQVSCRCAVTAGYLMSAWHDLGLRNALDICDCDDADPAALLPSHHDDANILSFNGLFIRGEYAF